LEKKKMRKLASLLAGVVFVPAVLAAQVPSEPFQPVATMKQLMVEIIHPASNEILLLVNRGGPTGDKEWADVRRSAMTLAECGNLLIMRNRDDAWISDAKALIAVGTTAYTAAQAKDVKGLTAMAEPLDGSCTTCHKHFRPTVFTPAR
jgi:hypothetical protein